MRRAPIARAAAAVVLVLLGARPAAAQDPQDPYVKYIGQPIVAVDIRLDNVLDTSEVLRALVDIKPGEGLTREAVRRVSDRFGQMPRIQGVSVSIEERPGGIAVVYDLEPAHPIERLEFSGDLGLTPEQLERHVRDQFNGLPTRSRQNDVGDAVMRLLQDEGYRSAEATTRIVQTHDPHRASLAINVEAGSRTVIGSITVEGQSPLSRERVLDRLGLDVGAPYRARSLEAELAELRDSLRGDGYYTATARSQPAFSGDGKTVALGLTVNAGPLVRIEVTGDLPGKLDDYLQIKQQGSVDPDLLDDGRARIERALKRDGYWHARVSHASTNPAPNQQVITFAVDRGQRYRIAEIDIPAGLQITPAEVKKYPYLETGAWFSEQDVRNTLLVIRLWYFARGFHQAALDPKYDEVPGRDGSEGGVIIRPNITEGPRAVVSRIVFDLGDKPAVAASALRPHMLAIERGPYVKAVESADMQALSAYYESLGFQQATVAMTSELNSAGTEAALTVRVREGPRILVGEIIVVGNEKVSRDAILKEITLRRGEPYSEAARFESQRRLTSGLSLRNVRILAEPTLPGETETRIVISVEDASSTTLSVGGGAEVGTRPVSDQGVVRDVVEVAPRGFVEVGRQNLGGRNRAISFYGRAGLKRRKVINTETQDRGSPFIEYRTSVSYRERYVFQTDADFLAAITSEQAVQTNYSFLRQVANAEVLYPLANRVSVSGRYSLELTKLFDAIIPEDEQLLVDRLFPQVRLSILAGGAVWDRRNDAVSPTRGYQVLGSLDLAPRAIGSEVGFAKSFVQATFFRPLKASPRMIFAGRAQLGLARGFRRTVPLFDEAGNPIRDQNGNPVVEEIADVPASHRFFAGGSTTVRGFQLDRLGVPEILNPDGLSNGGNGLIVLNAELRAAAGRLFGRNFGVVGFVDAGNVFERAGDIDLGRLRATAGFGFRYDSWIGPLRLDFGFKLDRFVFRDVIERRWEFHLSIGEVF